MGDRERERNRAEGESPDRAYYVMTPHLVLAACEDPYQLALWTVIKMIAGEEGQCTLGTADLAALAMMSTGKCQQARAELLRLGLIEGRLYRDEGHPRAVWHLRIPDLWPANIDWRQGHDSLRGRVALKRAQRRGTPAAPPAQGAPGTEAGDRDAPGEGAPSRDPPAGERAPSQRPTAPPRDGRKRPQDGHPRSPAERRRSPDGDPRSRGERPGAQGERHHAPRERHRAPRERQRSPPEPKKIPQEEMSSEQELHELIDRNLEEIFKIRYIKDEHITDKHGRIETLGLDESNRPVVIEYKKTKDKGQLVQANRYMTWI